MQGLSQADYIVIAFMVVMIVGGSYMSYRPYRAPVPTSSAPITAVFIA